MTELWAARKLADSHHRGLWHYTFASDESDHRCVAYPVGYCADDCPGHSSEHAAREHYATWVCDGPILDRIDPDLDVRCVACGEWTQRRVMFERERYGAETELCDAHDARLHLGAQFFSRFLGADGRAA